MSKAKSNGPRDVDAALDQVVEAMTTVDETAVAHGQARVIAALRDGAPANWISGPLSRRPWALPLAATGAAALLVAALVTGGFWSRTRPDATPGPTPTPTQTASAPAGGAIATSPLTGSGVQPGAQPSAVSATASLPSIDSRPPQDAVSGTNRGSRGRSHFASRDSAREDQQLAAREQEPPIGDPLPALTVESITPSPLAAPEPIATARVEPDAIVIEPIRISAFDAPPTPRSH